MLFHDELKNVNHDGPPWRPCRGLRISNHILLDRAQKVGPVTCVTQPCMCIISWDTRGALPQPRIAYIFICNLTVNVWKCLWKIPPCWRTCCYTSTGRWSSLFIYIAVCLPLIWTLIVLVNINIAVCIPLFMDVDRPC